MLYTQYIAYVQDFGAEILGLYTIQDYVEVFLFILIIYQILIWLKKDHTKHLLLSSYAYFSLLYISSITSCTVLFSTLLIGAPAYVIFCIIVHQKQLQKNFINFAKNYFTPQTIPQKNWLDILVQTCLISSHHKKNITCIIQRNDNISNLLDVPFILSFPIQQASIHFVLANNHIDHNSIIWIQEPGIIQSVNVFWNKFLINEILIKPIDTMTLHHEAALLFTQKSDAIIFEINTTLDMHTVWYQGQCIQQVTIQQLLHFIKKIMNEKTESKIMTKKTMITSTFIKGEKNDKKHHLTP